MLIICLVLSYSIAVILILRIFRYADELEDDEMHEPFLITETEYESLPVETARKYRYCPKCNGFYNSHKINHCVCQIDENKINADTKEMTGKY